MIIRREHIDAILFGVAVGDALGVPVEFRSREYLTHNPVSDMLGYGTHDQPKGTWSDDSSMTFCLAETLLDREFSTRKLANRFINWKDVGFWTAHGHVFDIGNTTRSAIENLRSVVNPEDAGGKQEADNGNGSLMRILPLVISTMHLNLEELYSKVNIVSSLTHAHIRSVNCCFYYVVFARQLIYGHNIKKAYESANHLVTQTFKNQHVSSEEINQFERIISGKLASVEEREIRGSGYVVHSLEAAIWSVLTTNSYSEAVLKTINLGEDTDTTGAITGGIAALHFGFKSIPSHWLQVLARKHDIEMLANRISLKYSYSTEVKDIPSPGDTKGIISFANTFFNYNSPIGESFSADLGERERINISNIHHLTVNELGHSLFLYLRAVHHTGDDLDMEWINTIIRLMKRHVELEADQKNITW